MPHAKRHTLTAHDALQRLAGLLPLPWPADPTDGYRATRCLDAGRRWIEKAGLSPAIWRAHLAAKPPTPAGLAAELAAVGIALVRTADPPGWTATLLQLAGGGRAEGMARGLFPAYRGLIRRGPPELMHVDRDECADDQPQAEPVITARQRQRAHAAAVDAFIAQVEADGDALIESHEVLDILGCSASSLTLLVRDEQLPAYAMRGRRRYRLSEVEALAEMADDPDDARHWRPTKNRRRAAQCSA